MIQLIKAWVTYRIWIPGFILWGLAIFLILLETRLWNKKLDDSIALLLLNFSWVVLSGYFVRIILQKREYDENHIKMAMMLPIDAKSVGKARNYAYIFVLITGIPIWFISLGFVPTYSVVQKGCIVVSMNAIVLFLSMLMVLANDLQYLAKRRRVVTMLLFSGLLPILVAPVLFESVKVLYYDSVKLLTHPIGALASILLASVMIVFDNSAFAKRVDYSRVHNPELTLWDFLRTFKGEVKYRGQW